MKTFKTLCTSLENKIKDAYTEGVTMEQAEKLAGEFLYAQIQVSNELKIADLNARMRKTGVKAVRAAIYLEEAKLDSNGKKPTVDAIAAAVDVNDLVQGEQRDYDTAEVELADLERYYNIFREGHIFFRSVAKGVFGG